MATAAAPHHGPRISPERHTPRVWPVIGTGLNGRGTVTRERAAVRAAATEALSIMESLLSLFILVGETSGSSPAHLRPGP